MGLNIKQFTILLLLLVIFSFNMANAQETNFFIGKPDKNIKRVVVYDVDIEKDTTSLSYIVEFNKNGQVIKESQPEVHIHVNYKYDKKGRLITKDALYGESFANGTTDYHYSKGVEIEKNKAMGFYSEIRKEFNKAGNIREEQTFYVAGGMGESKIETIIYKYNKNDLLAQKIINIDQYDFEVEPGEVPEMEPEILIKKLKAAKIKGKESFIESYEYNLNKQLISKEFISTNSKKKLYKETYEYDDSGLLAKEKKGCFTTDSQVNIPCEETKIERKYTTKNQLESITTERDLFLNIETYKDGRLVSSYGRYARTDSYRYSYKYEYYED